MGIYENTIIIKGRHATRMKLLSSKLDDKTTQGLFARNLDVYLTAPIVGMVYGRKADVDTTDPDSTKIFSEQLNHEMDNLLTNFRMLTLLNKNLGDDIDSRISYAFRYERDDEQRKVADSDFEKYLLGGIDVLYEKLIANASSTSDYVINMFEFIDDFTQQFSERYSFEEIDELCANSKK